MALVGGLDFAHANGIDEIRVYLDNQLVVDQINGLAAVKHSTLKSLHGRVVDSLNTFSDQRVYWIPRERNKPADALVRSELYG